MNSIEALNLTKVFKIPHDKSYGLKAAAISLLQKKKRTYEELRVLDKVNFSIKKGEFVGITGQNGTGKSTLLRIIAGVIKPTEGTIRVNGRVSPLLEVGAEFQNELTARENIFLYGAIFGLTRKEIKEKFNEIVDFSGLQKFLDTKLKTFSSGMIARLNFSIARCIDADILLVDEALAVGDQEFQEKCYQTFRELKKRGKTVLLVSHDMILIRKFAGRVFYIEKGRIVQKG